MVRRYSSLMARAGKKSCLQQGRQWVGTHLASHDWSVNVALIKMQKVKWKHRKGRKGSDKNGCLDW